MVGIIATRGTAGMALLRLKDFEPNYRDAFDGDDIIGLDVYTEGTDSKIGTVKDLLVDDAGQLRYLVVDIGFWIFGKQVLLPMGRAKGDWKAQRIYAGLSKEQAEKLPEFDDSMVADYDYEERVRGVYRTPATRSASSYQELPLEAPVPVETAAPLDAAYAVSGQRAMPNEVSATYDRNSYSYQKDPSLYEMNDTDHQSLKLYEERLVVNKKRQKTGEVTLGKHIEVETARATVPVERERVVIERLNPTATGTVVFPSSNDFREGEVTRVEVYEETPDIHKEAFVREEVRVRKEVAHNTVQAEETVRREELDVNTSGGLRADDSI